MKKLIFQLLVVGSFITFLASCDDDSETEKTPLTEAEGKVVVQDIVTLTAEINSLNMMGLDAFSTGMGNSGGRYAEDEFCGEIEFSYTETQVKMSVDYGDQGCEDEDGSLMKGKIIFTIEGNGEGSTITQTMELVNFSSDGNGINGTFTSVISNFNEEDFSSAIITTSANDVTLTFAEDGSTLKYSGTHTYSFEINSEDFELEVLKVDGTATMVSRKGITISYDIQNDLNYKSACFEKDVYHAVAGLMAVSTSIHNDFTLDFGDSTCDNIVTVKTGDLEFDLELENE